MESVTLAPETESVVELVCASNSKTVVVVLFTLTQHVFTKTESSLSSSLLSAPSVGNRDRASAGSQPFTKQRERTQGSKSSRSLRVSAVDTSLGVFFSGPPRLSVTDYMSSF